MVNIPPIANQGGDRKKNFKKDASSSAAAIFLVTTKFH
jgi:hypothetical protein